MPIRLQIADGIGHITIDRPPLNILDVDTLEQLNKALGECEAAAVRGVWLDSAVARAFSAGVEVRDHLPERLDAMLDAVRENARLMLSLPAITIAAVNGVTLGGGAELALLCDLVVAAEETTFGFPEIRMAAFPPIAAVLLPDRWGWPAAMRLLTGEWIDAKAAQQMGLVSTVVAPDRLTPTAAELAHELAHSSSVAVRALVAVTRGRLVDDVMRRIDEAMATYRQVIGPSHDAKEGIEAFLQKRAPAWSHR